MDRRTFIGTATSTVIAMDPIAKAVAQTLESTSTDVTPFAAGDIVFHDPGDTGFVGVTPSGADYTFSPAIPAGYQVGDWLFCAVYQCSNNGILSANTPGWQLLPNASFATTRRKLSIYGKRVTVATEPACTFTSTLHAQNELIEAQIFCVSNVPATDYLAVEPAAYQDTSAHQSVEHQPLTPAGDNQGICIIVCKRDANTTGSASKPGFTELFTVSNPTGTGATQGTLACVYQVQTTATAVPGGASNPVSLPGGANVGTSFIMSFKRATVSSSVWASHGAQSWKTPLPGVYIDGMQVYEGMSSPENWIYFIGADQSDYTSNESPQIDADRRVAVGSLRQAAAFVRNTGGVTVIDLGSGCMPINRVIGPTGNYKHWTGAWSAGPLVYRGTKFEPAGNRHMYDNFVIMTGDDNSADIGWAERDCFSTGGSNGQYSHHFLHNLFLFAGSDEIIDNFRAAANHCLLYSIIGPALHATSHDDETDGRGTHGFAMYTRGSNQHTHRNVFWGCSLRHPLTSCFRQSIVNNLIFNYWRNDWASDFCSGVALRPDPDPVHSNAPRQYNVIGNLYMRGMMDDNIQSDVVRGVGGNPPAGTLCHTDLNRTYGFTPRANQQAFIWENSATLYSPTLLTGAATDPGRPWSSAWGDNKETVHSFGPNIGLAQAEALAALEMFRASCGARPGMPDRFERETYFFDLARNAALGTAAGRAQMKIYNSVGGTAPNSKSDWETGDNWLTLRMEPNLGGWPGIPYATNWQGTIDDTLAFLGIATGTAPGTTTPARNAEYSTGTFNDGVTPRSGYTQFQVAHIQRKWFVGNPRTT